MYKKFFVLLLALATSLPALYAQDDESLMRGWIQTLGSDDFGGRKPMTEYETKTINYLAGQMKELGLQPAFGDSYFQQVMTISTISRPVGGKFHVKGAGKKTDLVYPDDLVVWTARATRKVEIPSAEFIGTERLDPATHQGLVILGIKGGE